MLLMLLITLLGNLVSGYCLVAYKEFKTQIPPLLAFSVTDYYFTVCWSPVII